MATGAAGTEAQVTNSGTEQAAVLNFVIPQGNPGESVCPQFLNAYSTPAQPASSGAALIFDRNAAVQGTAITHQSNSAEVNIQQTGYYEVSLHTTMSAVQGSSFPQSILIALQLNGAAGQGAAARHGVQSAAESANLTFSPRVAVSSTPAKLTVTVSGGQVLYSDCSITVNRLGSL